MAKVGWDDIVRCLSTKCPTPFDMESIDKTVKITMLQHDAIVCVANSEEQNPCNLTTNKVSPVITGISYNDSKICFAFTSDLPLWRWRWNIQWNLWFCAVMTHAPILITRNKGDPTFQKNRFPPPARQCWKNEHANICYSFHTMNKAPQGLIRELLSLHVLNKLTGTGISEDLLFIHLFTLYKRMLKFFLPCNYIKANFSLRKLCGTNPLKVCIWGYPNHRLTHCVVKSYGGIELGQLWLR